MPYREGDWVSQPEHVPKGSKAVRKAGSCSELKGWVACCMQEGRAGVGAGMDRCPLAWGAEKIGDSEGVMSDEKSLWTEQAMRIFGWSEEQAPWSAATHFLRGRAQRQMPSRDPLLELGRDLGQDLVQMCLADGYVGPSSFSPRVTSWQLARQSCNCGGRLQIRLYLLEMVNPEHLAVTWCLNLFMWLYTECANQLTAEELIKKGVFFQSRADKIVFFIYLWILSSYKTSWPLWIS